MKKIIKYEFKKNILFIAGLSIFAICYFIFGFVTIITRTNKYSTSVFFFNVYILVYAFTAISNSNDIGFIFSLPFNKKEIIRAYFKFASGINIFVALLYIFTFLSNFFTITNMEFLNSKKGYFLIFLLILYIVLLIVYFIFSIYLSVFQKIRLFIEKDKKLNKKIIFLILYSFICFCFITTLFSINNLNFHSTIFYLIIGFIITSIIVAIYLITVLHKYIKNNLNYLNIP